MTCQTLGNSASNAPPILAVYLENTGNSRSAHARTEALLPGGTLRQAGYWTPYPLTFERAAGPFLWDIDDNRRSSSRTGNGFGRRIGRLAYGVLRTFMQVNPRVPKAAPLFSFLLFL
ncbi:MAG TPA: hypothetical protein QGG18_08260 [Rhodospirillales bacterium]|nr:hypothetical protein [Rhodospirillales bacterium]